MTMRRLFWMLAVVLGGAQTWYTRHRIFSDGISYLEIAQKYASGDWHGALNAYWSPLYSWAIAAYLLVFRPAPYWEVSALHVINFSAFLGSCWVFERFLRELIALRPEGLAGLSARTLMAAGYVAILHAGLLMVGIGYVSPDMIALFLTGAAAWLTLRLGQGWFAFVALGVVFGAGYLDRTAFAPWGAISLLTLAVLKRRCVWKLAASGLCFAAVAAPFAIAISMQKGYLTLGESGKLSYGWEVDGAARSIDWQGEPGDIGRPAHPARKVLETPVPVYEFAEPVGGSYPPWYDPSYWYEGIRPGLKPAAQLGALWRNTLTTGFYAATSPGFLILLSAIAMASLRWRAVRWELAIPAAAGIGMYCLVFVDKRYLAGFFAVLPVTLLAGVSVSSGRFGAYLDRVAMGLCVLFTAALGVWLFHPLATAATDLKHGREGEANVSWMLARKFMELGVKPGERIGYVGAGMEADWVRLAGARIVAEVPVVYRRHPGIQQVVDPNIEYPTKFFALDEEAREGVYAAFRHAGAAIAVTPTIPAGGKAGDWKAVLDPNGPGYPKGAGQVLEQSPAYYRWLEPRTEGRTR
jgi:hypothetical protein